MMTFESWLYISDIPRKKGSPCHLWICQLCGRNHMTPDKAKPSPNLQRDRKVRGE